MTSGRPSCLDGRSPTVHFVVLSARSLRPRLDGLSDVRLLDGALPWTSASQLACTHHMGKCLKDDCPIFALHRIMVNETASLSNCLISEQVVGVDVHGDTHLVIGLARLEDGFDYGGDIRAHGCLDEGMPAVEPA